MYTFPSEPSAAPSEIKAYVPSAVYRDGKDEQICPRYYEDLAILDPSHGFTALSARGIYLSEGKQPRFSDGEIGFIERNLSHDALLVRTEDGVLLVLQSLFRSSGLSVAVLPHGAVSTVAHVLKTVFGERLLCSPSVERLPSDQKDFEAVYRHCDAFLQLCDLVLRPTQSTDFRTHCAAVARLAGCKADITALPSGSFPLHESDHFRWVIFLLCTLLSLRGDSALEVKLELIQADRREFHLRLTHCSEHKPKEPVSDAMRRLFDLPAFSDYRLSCSKSILTVETELRRKHSPNLLRSLSSPSRTVILRIEIV